MNKIKNPVTIILLSSFFLISTCTNDNSITGNTDQTLGKTTGLVDVNSPTSEDDEGNDFFDVISKILLSLDEDQLALCFFCTEAIMYPWFARTPDLSKPYDFRDNFLKKSEKGWVYIAIYFELSRYGIENNLVHEYSNEHNKLLKNSIDIAYNLQYGNNSNQILINKSISDDLKDMLKVYRSSPNHWEIEEVLQFLEADLEKYYNQPKYVIAADF